MNLLQVTELIKNECNANDLTDSQIQSIIKNNSSRVTKLALSKNSSNQQILILEHKNLFDLELYDSEYNIVDSASYTLDLEYGEVSVDSNQLYYASYRYYDKRQTCYDVLMLLLNIFSQQFNITRGDQKLELEQKFSQTQKLIKLYAKELNTLTVKQVRSDIL